MNINHNLTENYINDIDVKLQLKHQIQIQETKEFGWIFDKINSMKIRFSETGELNGSSYVKVPLRSNALINIKNNDKYCFLWSILTYLHLVKLIILIEFQILNFDEINIEGFDLINGCKCSDVHKFESSNNLSINKLELNFYQDKNKWKRNIFPIKISKNDSDRVGDLITYKDLYSLIKKLNVF